MARMRLKLHAVYHHTIVLVFDIYLDHKITATVTRTPPPAEVTGVLDLVVELLTTDGSNET